MNSLNHLLSDAFSLSSIPSSIYSGGISIGQKIKSVLTHKVVLIGLGALAALAAIYLLFRCCKNYQRNRGAPYHPPAPYNPPYVPPYNPAPYIPPYNPPYNPHTPYYNQPGISNPNGNINETITQQFADLIEVEKKILDTKDELKFERNLLETLQKREQEISSAGMDTKPTEEPIDKKEGVVEGEMEVADAAKEEPVVVVDNPIDPKDAELAQALAFQSDDDDEGITDNQQKIFDLQEELEKQLKEYPKSFKEYLIKQFKNNRPADKGEVHERISVFTGILDEYSSDKTFTYDCFKAIDEFLTEAFFTSPTDVALQESKKLDLILFHEFFAMANKHLEVIEGMDSELAIKIKVRLANLPLAKEIDRKTFKNVYLSEEDQRDILIAHFLAMEGKAVDDVVTRLKGGNQRKLTALDLKRMAKLAVRDGLEHANKEKLRDALKEVMQGQAPASWNNYNTVVNALNQFYGVQNVPNAPAYGYNYNQNYYQGNAYNYGQPYYGQPYNAVVDEIDALKRASTAKAFFKNQIGVEPQPLIPHWYHTTKAIIPIINTGVIEVRHEQAFKGSWVSTEIEPGFGAGVLLYSHRIAEIDPDVFIGYEFGPKRWRGLQKPIPFQEKIGNGPRAIIKRYFTYAGVQNKADKPNVIQALKNHGIVNPRVFTFAQVNFIYREFVRVIGNPNLTEQWWGKGDVNQLERAV